MPVTINGTTGLINSDVIISGSISGTIAASANLQCNQLSANNVTTTTLTGSIIRAQNPKFYAFDGAGQSTTGTLVAPFGHITIQFTQCPINIGNGFSTSTYRFTAPIAGHYQFIFNAMCGAANVCRYRLIKNNTTTIGTEFFAANQIYEHFGGNWLEFLNQGEFVELKLTPANTEVNNIHVNYRAFSGFLLP